MALSPMGRALPPLRVAFAGDSITWGDGLLDDGFVGEADRFLRERAANTLFYDELDYQGKMSVIRNPKLYRGGAAMLTGVNAEVSFQWTHERLVLISALQRHNDAASLVEMYVDGELADTFSTFNEWPCGSGRITFTTDGVSDKYDLGRAFTYDHQVVLDGERLNGELNQSGYGGGIPDGHLFEIIRKSVCDSGSAKHEIRHFIWFRAVPLAGLKLEVAYRYGESVTYARTTVGEAGAGLDSPLESRYGEGDVAHDPAHPSPMSSGLDFRESDERAMREWTFHRGKERTITFRIKGFDPCGGNSGLPCVIVNAVTDCCHHIMNAGIGGWTAKLFNEDRDLRNVKRIAEWKPDLVFIGLGTNDDWGEGNGFVASRGLAGLSEEELRSIPTLLMKSCSRGADGRYRVETAELVIGGVAERSVVIDWVSADLSDVREGDVLVIGDYDGDNRNVQFRIVEQWDAASRTAWFNEPLAASPFTRDIYGYVGQSVRVKRIDGFIGELKRMIETLRSALPGVAIALIETGLSNFQTRLLTGYPEKIGRLAEVEGLRHVRVYEELMRWQYSRPCDLSVFIGRDGDSFAGGGDAYSLYAENGIDIQENAGYGLRNWSVKVDGVERYGDGCRIEGGYALAFRPEVPGGQLSIESWNGRSRHPAVGYRFLPTRLVFANRVPPSGSRIEVAVASEKWSLDDAHLSLEGGQSIYNAAIKRELESWLADITNLPYRR